MSDITYRIPETLSGDISKFASLIKEFEDKTLSPDDFKAFRVPMGVYEQRKDGTYMARIRTTGGVIYPEQLQRIIAIVRAHDSQLLHLTTRQEVQIQNLTIGQLVDVLRELQEVGLATKGGGGNTVRNILVSENSGIASEETFDTTSYAMELTSRMIAEPDSYQMPRKLKIAFSSDDKNIDYAAINDIGLVAKIQEGKRGFRVYVGGGAGAKPTTGWLLFDFLPESELYILVKSLKKFFSAYGDRTNRSKARMRFIFYRLGEEETLRIIKEYYEAEKKTGIMLTVVEPKDERPSYDYKPLQLSTEANKDFELWKQRYVTPQRQKGYSSVLLPIILGNIGLDDKQVKRWNELLSFLQRFGNHTIRFTTTQSIRLRNLPEAALPELFTLLKELSEETTLPLITNNIVSCTGADTCRMGIVLSKDLAAAIRRELLQSSLDLDRLSRIAIHVTGCPNSCGQQLWADLGFSGKVLRNVQSYPGYQVYLAADRNADPKLAEPIGSLSAHDAPFFVIRLLEDYFPLAGKRSFTDYLKNEGREKALQLLEEYKTIPSYEEDKSYYFDKKK